MPIIFRSYIFLLKNQMSCMKFEVCFTPSTIRAVIPSSSFFSLYEITVGMENSRNASVTDMTPIAEDRRPEKGNVSGDRPH
mmetsp:Transcript_21877/g.32206  ORF Transcript_21877/g.32206 Transcript_21877/m.32206 type:complete len:81 (+) Transcript_21877:163-405(+)